MYFIDATILLKHGQTIYKTAQNRTDKWFIENSCAVQVLCTKNVVVHILPAGPVLVDNARRSLNLNNIADLYFYRIFNGTYDQCFGSGKKITDPDPT